MADMQSMADQIREIGLSDFADSNDAHENLVNLSKIVEATQETLSSMAEKIREAPGITNDYAEAAEEAAGSLSGVADELHGKVGLGIVRD